MSSSTIFTRPGAAVPHSQSDQEGKRFEFWTQRQPAQLDQKNLWKEDSRAAAEGGQDSRTVFKAGEDLEVNKQQAVFFCDAVFKCPGAGIVCGRTIWSRV